MSKTLPYPCLEDFHPRGRIGAEVLKVIDGDTIWVGYLNDRLQSMIRVKVRFNRINAPELKGFKGETPEAKAIRLEAANKSKDVVNNLIGGSLITLNITGSDLYGRLLADVLVPINTWTGGDAAPLSSDGQHIDLSEYMLQSGYAVPFNK